MRYFFRKIFVDILEKFSDANKTASRKKWETEKYVAIFLKEKFELLPRTFSGLLYWKCYWWNILNNLNKLAYPTWLVMFQRNLEVNSQFLQSKLCTLKIKTNFATKIQNLVFRIAPPVSIRPVNFIIFLNNRLNLCSNHTSMSILPLCCCKVLISFLQH